jgi:predicted N-acetyltransferase YhbS
VSVWPEPPITIRPACAGDAAALRRVERAAGERFRHVGLGSVADHEPATVETLGQYAADGRAWVALDDARAPVGYLLVDDVDGNAHIEQVSVMPEQQGRGIGTALVGCAVAWANAGGCPALTLTTFTDVPWNRPYYERLGFRVLGETELGPQLRSVRDAEAAHGLDPSTRVCMRLDLSGA